MILPTYLSSSKLICCTIYKNVS